MQKKIIALAVAAAFSAPAFAETTVYGIADAALVNRSATGVKSQLNVLSGGLSTSRLGFKATEGLDNGWTAIAVLEFKLDVADAATTVGSNRQKMLAVAGDFGTVAAGFLQTTGYDFSGKYQPFAGSAVDPYSAANPTALINTGSRAPRAVAYISPNMNGLTFAYNHSFDVGGTAGLVASGAATGNLTTANLFSVNYDQGPLSVGGVYAATANDDTAPAVTTVSETGLGATYDLGVAKVMGTYLSSTPKNGSASTQINFSAVAPVGPGTLVAGFAKNSLANKATGDTTSFTVAFLKGMSKTVTAYGAIEKINKAAGTGVGAVASSDTTVLAVGLRKKF
ncbi:MAG: porin [Gammaproteobacteria bacterium]|nr:porin [Gammaproteobacteria bacterium]MBU1624370.1 porin [Gammaproteobacteria bacterium]MBU1981098.1 porin [Gammaproteobacteria bacterium]